MTLQSFRFLVATPLFALCLFGESWEKLPDGSLGRITEVKASDGTPLAAYVRKPDGPGPFPVVVLIHGGGASKETTYDLGRRTTAPTGDMVAAGWVVFSADFSARERTGTGPSAIDDAMAEVAAARALPYVDGKRLALFGGSHGAQVITRLASRMEARAAVLCAPAVLDLPLIAKAQERGEEIAPILKKLIANLEQRSGARASEIAKDRAKYHYESSYTEAAKVRFPMLIINGRNDTSSPVSVVNAYWVRIRVNGHMVETYLPQNGPHGFYFGHPDIPETKEAAKHAVAFLKRQFADAPPQQPDRPRPQQQQMAMMSKYQKENPPRESTGMVPLIDLKGSYQGEEGGLYPGGGNTPPPGHLKIGMERAKSIQPLDAAGRPSPGGKIGLITVGMSNTTMESQAFLRLAKGDPELNPKLVLIDGAQNGRVAMVTADPEAEYWKISDERVREAGATPQQVQVAWLKQANGQPTGNFKQEARQLEWNLIDTVQNVRAHYPNIKIIYFSSRIYAGYAASPLNPEPYSYEGAFAVKWTIGEQMKGSPELKDGPWLAWGPYLWADGMKGRSDGLIWRREELGADGTHPSETGREKVAKLLMAFLKQDPTSKPWFLRHD